MRYLCLVHFDEGLLDALSPAALAALERESLAYDLELQSRGQLLVAHALQRLDTAKVVQLRQGRIHRTDGPFIETKEQLGGFLLIDVPDLNAAIQVAARVPMARYASIEVRRAAVVERMAP
ncbi:YciI family protein [Variovorax dokdonensis]|uniref:YciI family protein n=1 Tax=Variovorax dokdonensis TaxID=344883 RepID=A0ABT7N534_9BURK|nr:YciI family protein [Variovorax dokdonensis]MDM0043064.1 YciI family protein [Variovorax dokdonensis]